MKKYLFALFIVAPLFLVSQALEPDTMWVENDTDSTFIIALGTKNQNNGKINVEYIDRIFDSLGVAQFAYERIYDNEMKKWEVERSQLQAAARAALYNDADRILNNFTGIGFLQSSMNRFKSEFVGPYIATLGQSRMLLILKQDGTATQVNPQGQPVQDGLSGTWDVINANRWRLKGFFPDSILPANSVFNRIPSDGDVFKALGSNLVLRKLKSDR